MPECDAFSIAKFNLSRRTIRYVDNIRWNLRR